MLLKQFAINQLEFLLPEALVSVSDALQQSIGNHGVMVPPVVSGNIICDGHRRLAACKTAGIQSVFCHEVSGSAGLLFAELNSQRELSAYEVAAAFKQLNKVKQDNQSEQINQAEQLLLMKQTGLSESPQMRVALQFIADEVLADHEMLAFSLPVNTWRELGHLGDALARFGKAILVLPGTVAEKRNIAAMLRQAQRRNELPDRLSGANAGEVLASLQKIAQPRRSDALEKYEAAIASTRFPHGVTLKIDPTFAQPGIHATIQLTRNHTDRLDEARKAIDCIFAAVPEL